MKYQKFLSETRGKSAAELAKLEKDLREKLRETRLELATGKSKNGAAVKKIRKDLARVLTVARAAK